MIRFDGLVFFVHSIRHGWSESNVLGLLFAVTFSFQPLASKHCSVFSAHSA